MSAFIDARGCGLALGVLADAAFGDPPNRAHPVAWFGTAALAVEKTTYNDSRAAGAKHVATLLIPLAIAGTLADRATRTRPLARCLSTAVVTWAAIGAHSLVHEGNLMADALDAGNLDAARGRLSHLCGRLASALDEPELARATVESLAENTADSVVASLFWGALAGIPGILVHRSANTLDAMVGHHNERYENFGWAAANLDDLLDYLPARMTGILATLAAPVVGGKIDQTASIVRRDARNHPSPNGGWCESAFAGALGVQLGGRNIYPGGRVEDRGLLGDGPRPDAYAPRKAARLVTTVTAAAAATATVFCTLRHARKARR